MSKIEKLTFELKWLGCDWVSMFIFYDGFVQLWVQHANASHPLPSTVGKTANVLEGKDELINFWSSSK